MPNRGGMTVKLDLNPAVEAGLVAQAEARGLSLEAYVQQVLKERSVNGAKELNQPMR